MLSAQGERTLPYAREALFDSAEVGIGAGRALNIELGLRFMLLQPCSEGSSAGARGRRRRACMPGSMTAEGMTPMGTRERLQGPQIHPDAHFVRGRILALYAGTHHRNLGVWVWALVACRGRFVLLGTALAACGFGLRHAVDADHIAAIDNVTRKLTQERQNPLGVGLFFALGHSSVVIVASVVLAMTSSVGTHLREARELGAALGTVVSFGFLWLIGIANLLSLPSTIIALRRVRRGDGVVGPDIGALLAQQEFVARWLQHVFRLVRRSRDMLALGALFGLGFDTATEVLLLGISAAQVSHGMSVASALLFPALFTAGMTLIDTSDGLLRTGAYGWAFINPMRRLHYNIIVTVLSVTVAFAV